MFAPVSHRSPPAQLGVSYVEMLVTVTITAVIMLSMMGIVNTATESGSRVMERTTVAREARFAMSRMVQVVGRSPRLLLPLGDNPATNWPENLREQTVPPTAPLGDSSLATAVLAISLPRDVDLDGDGVADADNDGDGLFDEDPPKDNNHDGASGIALIDDNGDGTVDGDDVDDNDEDGKKGEDRSNGFDDDGDGSIDEDVKEDANNDGEPGVSGVDDDADLAVDEGDKKDDDEDGVHSEDWIDSVSFYLVPAADGSQSLVERTPVPWDTNADTFVTGADYRESVIASNVTAFRVERIDNVGGQLLVDLTLELAARDGEDSMRLQTIVRVGGAL